MKLQILSDLHLSVHPLERVQTDADVVVLAGDITRPEAAIAWTRGWHQPVVYVPGNHEFYGSSLEGTVHRLQHLAQGSQVHVLDNQSLVLGGVRFLGSTLWTDFLAAGPGAAQQAAMAQAQQCNRDFSRILCQTPPRPFTPQDAMALFARNVQWLEAQLQTPFEGPTVVVTHHAPSLRSVPARFAGSPLNASFVSDAEHLLTGGRAQLWIHGHLHDSLDYWVDRTRVLCNPRGYAQGGVNENAAFNAGLTVAI